MPRDERERERKRGRESEEGVREREGGEKERERERERERGGGGGERKRERKRKRERDWYGDQVCSVILETQILELNSIMKREKIIVERPGMSRLYLPPEFRRRTRQVRLHKDSISLVRCSAHSPKTTGPVLTLGENQKEETLSSTLVAW